MAAVASVQVRNEPLRVAFDEHYVGIVRLLWALTGNREIAEDLAQDAFVRLAPKMRALGKEEVGPYVRRIAINLWKNHLRRLAIEIRVRRHEVVTPRDAAESPDRWLDVATAVRRLPGRQRACVVLRFYEDLPESAVAEILGCSVGSVKTHTSRGLIKLRKELSHED
jgi:RNA polymerase sigma-70 factor (sigma-E family)